MVSSSARRRRSIAARRQSVVFKAAPGGQNEYDLRMALMTVPRSPAASHVAPTRRHRGPPPRPAARSSHRSHGFHRSAKRDLRTQRHQIVQRRAAANLRRKLRHQLGRITQFSRLAGGGQLAHKRGGGVQGLGGFRPSAPVSTASQRRFGESAIVGARLVREGWRSGRTVRECSAGRPSATNCARQTQNAMGTADARNWQCNQRSVDRLIACLHERARVRAAERAPDWQK